MLVYQRNRYTSNLYLHLVNKLCSVNIVVDIEYLRPGYRANLWWQRKGVCEVVVLSCSAVGSKQKGTPQVQLIHFQTQM